MKIAINKSTKVGNIQRAFSDFFPALKLEFYLRKHDEESVYPDNEKLKPGYTIASGNASILNDSIEIYSSDKVMDIEKMFYEKYGLVVQVFFKSKNKWIQTVKSDHYSLKRLEWESDVPRHSILL